MDKDEVPQDAIHTYGGHRKLFYATDKDGEYLSVQSSGWEAEAIATGSALEELDRLRADAWARASRGETSPLEYYMVLRRMDVALLSQTSGLWQWRVRRHFKPAVYATLGDKQLARYSDALGIDIPTLKTLKEAP